MTASATVMATDVAVAVGVGEGAKVAGVGDAPGNKESGKLNRRWEKLEMVS